MLRISTAFLLVLSSQLLAADPEKPLTLKADELAVLFDADSPDHAKLLARYDGKVIQLSGTVTFNSGVAAGNSYEGYWLRPTGKKDAHPIRLEWSKDPSAKRTKDRAHDAGQRGTALTVYGRAVFSGDPVTERKDGQTKTRRVPLKLTDVTGDPKTGGVPYKPKDKEPARLKKD